MKTEISRTLLGKTDLPPVELLNSDSSYPVLLVCEHAGQAIPASLQQMQLSASILQTHIAWDIGAAAVSRLVADRLGAPLVLQQYSRLVIDCNRPPDSPEAMPKVSDGVVIPFNGQPGTIERQQRIDEIFHPFQNSVKQLIARTSCRAVFSIHSFTRALAGQEPRPWDLGLLFRKDTKTSEALAGDFQQYLAPEKIGMNEPYSIDDDSDWFVPMHGESSGLPHSLLEICNDLIDTPEGQHLWAERLATVVARFVERDLT